VVTIKEVSTMSELQSALIRLEKEAVSSGFTGSVKTELAFRRGRLHLVRTSAESVGQSPDRKGDW